MRARRIKKHNASLVQSAQEHQKSKPVPWGKIIYLAIVLFLVFKVASWVYRNSLYIEGTGFISSTESFVETQIPGTIIKINCNVNDLVRRGDPLVYLGGYGYGADNVFYAPGSQANLRRRLVEAENELKILKKEISLVSGELRDKRAEKNRAMKLMQASAISRSQYIQISEREAVSAKRLVLLRTKAAAAQRLINALHTDVNKAAVAGNGYHFNKLVPDTIKTWPADRILRAPLSGKIISLPHKLGEVVQPGEPVVKIASIENFYVKAFVDVAAEGTFDVGDQVRIRFENGDRSLGTIEKIYIAADTTPHVFRGQFAAPQNMIVAEIKPADNTPDGHILAMKVKVYVKRSLI